MSEQRKRRTREEGERRILEAARELFTERGFEAVSTREIARRAEASETLVYRYFGSKIGLLEEVLLGPVADLLFRGLGGRALAHDEAGRLEATAAFVSSLLDFVEANRPLLAAFVANRLAGGRPVETDALSLLPFFEISEAQLRQRRVQAGHTDEVPIKALSRLNLGLVLGTGLLLDLLFPDGRPEPRKLAHALTRMIAATVAAEPPISDF
jgi:AcrR family transcriptional regulator